MYRICDLVSLDNPNQKLRRNVTENNAVEGMGIRFSDTAGTWQIKRVHGYSLLAD